MGLDASCHTIEHDEAAYLTCGADSDCPSGNVCYCDAATCSLGPLYPIIGGPYSNVCGPDLTRRGELGATSLVSDR